MGDLDFDTYPATLHAMRRAFIRALTAVLLVWSVAAACSFLLIDARNTPLLTDSFAVALASLLIACASVSIGLLMLRSESGGQSDAQMTQLWGRFTAAIAVGMTIRLIGTVVIFLTYRYYMASSTEMIAAMTLGWYLLLTSIEVIVLARTLPKPVGSDSADAASHSEMPEPLKV